MSENITAGEMNWTLEAHLMGVRREVAFDHLGVMGVPGTWYRVSTESSEFPITRNRGDALRLFQRMVFRTSGS